jgi:hydrogenase nickel incorporation protein HypA/HybF
VHELSIAREIIEIVEAEAARSNLTRVDTVNIRLGALTGVNPDALAFSFEASVMDTALDGARLVIEKVPIKGRCRNCQTGFEVEEFVFLCPQCASGDLEIISGEELDFDHLVGE